MNDEKQIEEMIEYLNNNINVERNSYLGKGCITLPLIEADKILTILQDIPNSCGHENGGEWISVEDRLPDKSGSYLTYDEPIFAVLNYSARYKLFNAFDLLENEDYVKCHAIYPSHWKPLPEPPKMKGGAE